VSRLGLIRSREDEVQHVPRRCWSAPAIVATPVLRHSLRRTAALPNPTIPDDAHDSGLLEVLLQLSESARLVPAHHRDVRRHSSDHGSPYQVSGRISSSNCIRAAVAGSLHAASISRRQANAWATRLGCRTCRRRRTLRGSRIRRTGMGPRAAIRSARRTPSREDSRRCTADRSCAVASPLPPRLFQPGPHAHLL